MCRQLRTAHGGCLLQFVQVISARSLSPEGFDWGQSNEGAAQLVVALLADDLGDEAALTYHRDFEEQVVHELPDTSWQLSLRAIGFV